ncbi:FAD/NAD(P)-binding domain-containing protein [Coniochaeta sp. PMI_546]|nr:FAD/NAD(P)-binding domain-containing protein [Coniochaeta sp. PMI_546]
MSLLNGATAENRPHVGIVGAGISGLRCADILLSQGFEVTILEARNRIGGRICQSDGLGYTVDIGPNWIHAYRDSEDPHPIYKLAVDTKTPLHRWNNKQLIFDSKGDVLPNEVTERLSTLLWEIIEEIPKEDSLHDFITRRAREVVSDDEERKLLIQMSEMFGAYVGEPVWKQSLRFAWMEECCGGDEMFVESNYSAIFNTIAKPALDSAKILLGKKVMGVATPESRTREQKVILSTEDGETYLFDDVVMTTPLGWLKKHLDVFSPPLPDRIAAAVGNISLSQLEKVFINFPSVWWTEDPSQDKFPCYTNWLTPEYAKDTNPSCWPQEIWDLSTFASPNNHATLLFYLYGDCSRYIVHMINGKSEEEKYQLLNDFFRPYYSRLPGYNADNDQCVPKAILATEWLKDELNGYGSYCNFQTGVEEADKDLLAIKNGCEERKLWFCGEHAAPFEECGTVAGAYLSGEAVGKRIAALYRG